MQPRHFQVSDKLLLDLDGLNFQLGRLAHSAKEMTEKLVGRKVCKLGSEDNPVKHKVLTEEHDDPK